MRFWKTVETHVFLVSCSSGDLSELITEIRSGEERPLTDFHDAKQRFSENVGPYLAVVCQSDTRFKC